MDVKIGKEFGSGMIGTVYASKVDGVDAITKIEKFNGDMTITSTFMREILFSDFARLHPTKFMSLIYHGVVETCDYKHNIPKNIPKDFKKWMEQKNKLRRCCVLSYVPVLEFTWNNRPRMTEWQYLDAFRQVVEGVNLMRNAGFHHRDIHGGNIMGRYKQAKEGRENKRGKSKSTKSKSNKSNKNNKGKTDGTKSDKSKIEWFIIDYGLVTRDDWTKTEDDAKMKHHPLDIMLAIFTFMMHPAEEYTRDHNIKWPPFKDFMRYIKRDQRYKELNVDKYLPPDMTDRFMKQECIAIIVTILRYDLWMDAIGLDSAGKHKHLITQQLDNGRSMLYAVKHCIDKNYNKIVRHIEKRMELYK